MTGQDRGNIMRALLLTSPNVLTDDWDIVKEKITYLFNTMHVSPLSVARSGALAFDLDEIIKPRYLFLERAGLYKHPHPKSVGHDNISAEPEISSVLEEGQ